MSATLEQIEAQVKAYNPEADVTGLDDAYAFARPVTRWPEPQERASPS